MNITEQFINPKKTAIRKWLNEILQERYAKHDGIAERITHCLITNKDMDDFSKLIAEIFEVGYLKCLNEYKVKLKEHGLQVKLKYNDD